jgi:hypothetical protein
MAAKIRQKKLDAIAAAAMPIGQKVVAQFKTADGESTGPPLNLPADATPEQLELLLNQLLNQVNRTMNLVPFCFCKLTIYDFRVKILFHTPSMSMTMRSSKIFG